jgi:hypothetical protein
MIAVLTRDGHPLGVANTEAELLDICGITVTTELVESNNPQYPLNMLVVARKRYTVGDWYRQSYIMKDERSAWAWVDGFTEDTVHKRISSDIMDKLRREFILVKVPQR